MGGAAVLPDYRREKCDKDRCSRGRCGRGWPWLRRRSARRIVGICAIALGVLIVLLCAPEWLAAMLIACLLFAIGVACFGTRF